MSTRPSSPSTGLAVGATHHFPHDHYEKLQRLFLHKPICWSYEEEVRVVKCIGDTSPTNGNSPSGNFSVLDVAGRPLYLFSIPPESICELYFGFRVDDELADDTHKQLNANFPHMRAYECALDANNLAVSFQEYMSIDEHLRE